MSGLLSELQRYFGDELRTARANAMRNPVTLQRYGVRGTPSLLLFHHTRVEARWGGHIDPDEVVLRIERLLPDIEEEPPAAQS